MTMRSINLLILYQIDEYETHFHTCFIHSTIFTPLFPLLHKPLLDEESAISRNDVSLIATQQNWTPWMTSEVPAMNIALDLPFLNNPNPFTNERIGVYFDKHSRMSLDTLDYFVKQISHLSKSVVILASA